MQTETAPSFRSMHRSRKFSTARNFSLTILEPDATAWVFMDGWMINYEVLEKYLPDLSIAAFKQALSLPSPEN